MNEASEFAAVLAAILLELELCKLCATAGGTSSDSWKQLRLILQLPSLGRSGLHGKALPRRRF